MSDVQKDQQPQQAAEAQRAPQGAYEADAPRIEPKRKPEAKFTDWASI